MEDGGPTALQMGSEKKRVEQPWEEQLRKDKEMFDNVTRSLLSVGEWFGGKVSPPPKSTQGETTGARNKTIFADTFSEKAEVWLPELTPKKCVLSPGGEKERECQHASGETKNVAGALIPSAQKNLSNVLLEASNADHAAPGDRSPTTDAAIGQGAETPIGIVCQAKRVTRSAAPQVALSASVLSVPDAPCPSKSLAELSALPVESASPCPSASPTELSTLSSPSPTVPHGLISKIDREMPMPTPVNTDPSTQHAAALKAQGSANQTPILLREECDRSAPKAAESLNASPHDTPIQVSTHPPIQASTSKPIRVRTSQPTQVHNSAVPDMVSIMSLTGHVLSVTGEVLSVPDMQPTAAAATPLNIITAPLTHAIPAGAALTHASTNALRQQPPTDTPVTKRGESATASHDFVGVATINTPAFAAETDEAATAVHTKLDTGSVQTAATAAVADVTCVSDTEKTDGSSTAMATVETAAEKSRIAAVSAQATQQCNTLQHIATHCNTLGDVASAVETPEVHMQSAPVEPLKTNNTNNDNNHAVSTRTEKKSATAQEMATVEETQVDELVVPTQLTRQKQDTAARCAPPRLSPSPPRAQTSEQQQHLASVSVDTTLKSAAISDTPTHAPKQTSIRSSKHTGTTAANVAHVATVTTGTHTGGFWCSKGALVHLVCLVVVAVLLGAGAVMLHEGSLFSPAALGAYSKGRPWLLTSLARASSSASAASAAVSRAGASAASAASVARTTSMTRMSVEWARYVRAIAHTCALRPAANLLDSTPPQRVEGFRAKDLDGSGRWSLDELREAMRDEGDFTDEARADIIFAAMDVDGDSALSFEEADGYAQRWLPSPFLHSPASASDGDSNPASSPQDSTEDSTQGSTEDSTERSKPHETAPMSSAPVTSSARAKTGANAEEGVPASATAATHPATAATHSQRPESDSEHAAPAAWLHALETAARASTDTANLQQKNTSGDTKDVGVVGAPSLGAITREQGFHVSEEKILKQAHSSSLESSSWNDGVGNDAVLGEKVVLDKMSGEKVLLDKLPGDSVSRDTVLLTSNPTGSSSMNAAWVWDSASAMLTASNIPELTQSLLVRMAESPYYASVLQFVAAVAEFAREMMRRMCAMADGALAGVTSKVFNGTATAYFAALKNAGMPA